MSEGVLGLGSLGISHGMFRAKSFRSWEADSGGRGVPVIAAIARDRRDRKAKSREPQPKISGKAPGEAELSGRTSAV